MQDAAGRSGPSGQHPPTGSSAYTQRAVGGLKAWTTIQTSVIHQADGGREEEWAGHQTQPGPMDPMRHGHFPGTPPTYGYDADRAEEQRRHHDILPYIDDSPSSSPHLSSKSRSSRDTLSSGSLESSKSLKDFF
ncbi:Breakpoint cluster region protein [Liparis tanakae]|uniref:Breakpoint cluster region protein n=1 Tax=Liparis tanakae TaxID=230148 RepID=A0A4Z2HYX5_9TELE|nr:Breakpoint cluster region protein [Liparis tanakae]